MKVQIKKKVKKMKVNFEGLKWYVTLHIMTFKSYQNGPLHGLHPELCPLGAVHKVKNNNFPDFFGEKNGGLRFELSVYFVLFIRGTHTGRVF